MLYVTAGPMRRLRSALIERIGRGLEDSDRGQIVVVPKQLTLETELNIMRGLKLTGSFRVQILSPERLCQRIFEETGFPEGERVDDRGRVMLMRAVLRGLDKKLTIYSGAHKRKGFAEKASRQAELFQQAQLSADNLRDISNEQTGVMRLKLQDMALILESYERLMEGRYVDGEVELNFATGGARNAEFIKKSDVWFYGFDIMPESLERLIATVCGVSPRAGIFLPVAGAERDEEVYEPVVNSYNRLMKACAREGVKRQFDHLGPDDDGRSPELKALERELFAYPGRGCGDPSDKVVVFAADGMRQEAQVIAGMFRRLARTRGYNWNDMAIVCHGLDEYSQVLREAFDKFEIPIFLASSRPASRHALAVSLDCALKLVEKNYRGEDAVNLMASGLTDMSWNDCGRFVNYIRKYDLSGQHLAEGELPGEDGKDVLELRERLFEPLIQLKDKLRDSQSLTEQLRAVYEYLIDSGIYKAGMELVSALSDAGEAQLANEASQVWNRIVGTFDQLAELMGPGRMAVRELRTSIKEALDAAEIKPLPQSADAVQAQGTDRMLTGSVKVVAIMGASDRRITDDDGLFTSAQRDMLSEAAKADLGGVDAAQATRFYIKTAVGMASDMIIVSFSRTGADGSTQSPGTVYNEMTRIFPDIEPLGGNARARLALSARATAFNAVARAISSDRAPTKLEKELAGALEIIPEAETGLKALAEMTHCRRSAMMMSPASAAKLYAEIKNHSATSLECYAGCPFAYFIKYGINPQVLRPYAMDARDEGVLLHNAIKAFTKEAGSRLVDMGGQEAEDIMSIVVEGLLSRLESGPMGVNAIARAQKPRLMRTAKMAARALAMQLRNSAFQPSELESGFSGLNVSVGKGTFGLEGRIDRVDTWPQKDMVRIIDYKRGSRKVDISDIYHGLQLQLVTYLAAASAGGNKPAGMFYFNIGDGIVDTQSRNPGEVEELRQNNFRLDGIAPEEIEVLEAMSPDYTRVLKVKMTKQGTPDKRSLTCGTEDLKRLISHSIKNMACSIDEMRRGNVDISPVDSGAGLPCRYCDYRSACTYDEMLDHGRIRHYKKLTQDEVKRLLIENEAGDN